jgi:hypothetical protein
MIEPAFAPDEQRVDELIQLLSVEIGPRPAGSPAERRAQERMGALLRSWGYRVERLPASFAPPPRFAPYYSLAAGPFLLAALLLRAVPWLTLALPLVVLALPELDSALLRRRKRIAATQNTAAWPADCGPQDVDLVLVAHVDTARANPIENSFLRSIQESIYPSMQRMAWILVLLALFPMLGMGLAPVFHYAALLGAGLLSATLVIFDVVEQLWKPDVYVPGAYDNASGVAVLMAVAEKLAARDEKCTTHVHGQQAAGNDPPGAGNPTSTFTEPGSGAAAHLRVGFLLTGAEETGMHGAESAAADFKSRHAAPPVLILDQVGAGTHLRWIRKLGTLRPLHTDAALNELLQRANPALEPLDHRIRSSDYEPFLRAGIPAAGLESSGSPDAARAYHTVHDTPAVIEAHMLAECLETLDRLVWIMEREKAKQ